MGVRQGYVLICLLQLLLVPLVWSQDDLCEPWFGYEKFMNIDEDTPVGTVIVTLNTSGTTDTIQLSMRANEFFAFNASTQELYVSKALDADGSSTVTIFLNIECQEPGKGNVDISIIVTLMDVNDNPPQFTQDHYYLSLGETTSVGQTFDSTVRATDKDGSFKNNAVYYSVAEGQYSNYFQFPDTLDPVLVLREPLDYEVLPNITITVHATNALSDPQLNSSTLLTIMVKDEDDLNPVFSSPLYEGLVLETARLNTTVNVTPAIHAMDADVTLGEPVVYSFHDARGTQNVFAIDPTTAEVRMVNSTPPTKVSIVVQATQKDNPSRYGVAMLVITVAGVNSNAPRFHQDLYEVYVSEAVPLGTIILFISATDEDFGSAIHYSIVGDNPLFSVSPQSGAINITGRLDYEAAKSHSFIVKASDGNMESTARVEVTVVDANDNPPVVPAQQLEFDVDRTAGQVITRIQAEDADAGTQLQFGLANYQNLFSIDESGNIRISADTGELTETQYQLLVVVSDNGEPPLQTTVSVTLKFPPLPVTEVTVMEGPSNDIAAIALGVVAAILLVIVIILVVYICRRRSQNSEQLDKARVNRSPDPRGLKFKNASRLKHIHFQGEDCSDGATTVQENPLKEAGAFNYGFVHPEDQENDRNMDEIHIETAVLPFRENNNGQGYPQDEPDSSEYGDTLPSPHKHMLTNGLFPDTSTESLNTSHTASSGEGIRQHLISNGITSFGTTSFGKQSAGGGGGGSTESALNAISMEGLDPDVSVAPQDQKSELTVYF